MLIMDRLWIGAAEASVHPTYPACEALLLIELDGPVAEADVHMQQVREICRANGAWEDRLAQRENERLLPWKGRKPTFATARRLAPHYIVPARVTPRTTLPTILHIIPR